VRLTAVRAGDEGGTRDRVVRPTLISARARRLFLRYCHDVTS
jgi:hypothetical protein